MIFTKVSKSILVSAVLLTMLDGCASALNPVGESAFSCPGKPQGITCKTPSAVYKSTQGSLPETENDKPMAGTVAGDRAAKDVKVTQADSSVNRINPPSKMDTDVKVPLPVRSSAQVMRIWIAPWIDKNEDLHVPSFLYTEVVARKWNLGQTEFAGNGVNVPFRVVEKAPGQSIALPVAKSGQSAHDRPVVTPTLDDINLGDQLPLPKLN